MENVLTNTQKVDSLTVADRSEVQHLEKTPTDTQKEPTPPNLEKTPTDTQKLPTPPHLEKTPTDTQKEPILPHLEKTPTDTQKEPTPPHLEKIPTDTQKEPTPPHLEKTPTDNQKEPTPPHLEKTPTDTQKDADDFTKIRAQLLARPDIFGFSGNVETSWRTYRGTRIGPYYRVAFWDEGRRKSIYLGRNGELAEQVRDLLALLQHDHRERANIRLLRRQIRRSLRREKAKLEEMLAPLGYTMKGYSFHQRRE